MLHDENIAKHKYQIFLFLTRLLIKSLKYLNIASCRAYWPIKNTISDILGACSVEQIFYFFLPFLFFFLFSFAIIVGLGKIYQTASEYRACMADVVRGNCSRILSYSTLCRKICLRWFRDVFSSVLLSYYYAITLFSFAANVCHKFEFPGTENSSVSYAKIIRTRVYMIYNNGTYRPHHYAPKGTLSHLKTKRYPQTFAKYVAEL